jgi:hypothetical protein
MRSIPYIGYSLSSPMMAMTRRSAGARPATRNSPPLSCRATRAWYEQQVRLTRHDGPELRELDGMFGRFAQPGAAFIDPALVTQDIAALRAIIVDVNAFTTKVLAHRDDSVGRSEPSLPPITWADLDAAIDAVGTIHKKYYSLCYPGEALGSLTPLKTREWTRLFDTAWMPPGFVAPHEFEFDPRP